VPTAIPIKIADTEIVFAFAADGREENYTPASLLEMPQNAVCQDNSSKLLIINNLIIKLFIINNDIKFYG
jgi:hypothetical protein